MTCWFLGCIIGILISAYYFKDEFNCTYSDIAFGTVALTLLGLVYTKVVPLFIAFHFDCIASVIDLITSI